MLVMAGSLPGVADLARPVGMADLEDRKIVGVRAGRIAQCRMMDGNHPEHEVIRVVVDQRAIPVDHVKWRLNLLSATCCR